MNIDTVVGSWKQFKGRIKVKYSRLIGDYPGRIAGQRTVKAGTTQRERGAASRKSP